MCHFINYDSVSIELVVSDLNNKLAMDLLDYWIEFRFFTCNYNIAIGLSIL